VKYVVQVLIHFYVLNIVNVIYVLIIYKNIIVYMNKKKLIYLKKLAKEREVIEKEYRKEENQLKYNYEVKYKQCDDMTNKIVLGEMTDFNNLITPADYEKYKVQPITSSPLETGIPGFWQKAVTNAKFFCINKKDEKVLTFLKDVRIEMKEDKLSFSVIFHFNPNEYFSEVELTKIYVYNEEQVLQSTEASYITWQSDEKNATKETKKKNKKKSGNVKTTTTHEDVDSFFGIFKSLNAKEVDDEYEVNEADREAEFVRDDLIPNALGYYLDIIELDEDEDEEEEEEDDIIQVKGKKK